MRLILPSLMFCLLLAFPARAQQEVDVELFLAVDVSRSMSPAELEIQRRGYAAALASDEVWAAISGGLIGNIAVTYVEWAGGNSQKVIVDWTLIDSPAAAQAVADELTANWQGNMRRTSISGAIRYATESMAGNEYFGLRRVIDISGDGPNNDGGRVDHARDEALAQGVIINGLPLMTTDADEDFFGRRWGIDDLDVYYRACVIGGPGAFVIPVLDWAQFADAVRRKLVLEIAGAGQPRIWKAQNTPRPSYDCLIGEKLRQRRQLLYSEP